MRLIPILLLAVLLLMPVQIQAISSETVADILDLDISRIDNAISDWADVSDDTNTKKVATGLLIMLGIFSILTIIVAIIVAIIELVGDILRNKL